MNRIHRFGRLAVHFDTKDAATPVMVYASGHSSTYWLALAMGQVGDNEEVELTTPECEWLQRLEDAAIECEEIARADECR